MEAFTQALSSPLQLVYCVPAVLLALAIVALTETTKRIVDVAYGKDEEGVPQRKKVPWLNRIVFPSIPVVFGIILAALIPLRPSVLVEAVEANDSGWWGNAASFGLWGAAVGQFADYIYSKVKSAIKDGAINLGKK